MSQLFTNNAKGTLNAGILAGDLSLTLTAGQGALFPNPGGGDYFLVTLYQMSGTSEVNHEIVKVTARAGDVFTIVRAQEGTAAAAFNALDPVELRVTAGIMTAHETKIVLLSPTAGKTLSWTHTLTLAGTDGTTHTLPATDSTLARTDAGQTFTGAQSITGSVTATGNGSFGSGNVTAAISVKSSVAAMGAGFSQIFFINATGTNHGYMSYSHELTQLDIATNAVVRLTLTTAGATVTGNLTFSGSARRILADFGNATIGNRCLFQTSVANDSTVLGAIPSGTGTAARFRMWNSSDPDNATEIEFGVGASSFDISSSSRGTGSVLPIRFYVGGFNLLELTTTSDIVTTIPINEVADYGSTGNAANIGSTVLFTATETGWYTVFYSLCVTQAATTSSTLPNMDLVHFTGDSNTSVSWRVLNSVSTNTLATASQSSFAIYVRTGTNISFSTTGYASSGATPMQYACHVQVVRHKMT